MVVLQFSTFRLFFCFLIGHSHLLSAKVFGMYSCASCLVIINETESFRTEDTISYIACFYKAAAGQRTMAAIGVARLELGGLQHVLQKCQFLCISMHCPSVDSPSLRFSQAVASILHSCVC